MPDVDASVFAIAFHFSLYSFSCRGSNSIRDRGQSGRGCLSGFSHFRVRTDCMTMRPAFVVIALIGAIHKECRTDINHGSKGVFDADEVDVK